MSKTQEQLDAALIDAAKNGDLDAVKKAYKQGANIHALDNSAVRWAAYNGHLEMARYLVEEHDADIHAENDWAVRGAAQNGHLEVVRYLVEEHNANIHAQDDYAVRMAAYNGHLETVRYLVEEQDANIHADDDYAVRRSAKKGHLEVVRYLAEKGANIHADNDRALRDAVSEDHLEIVKYLVEKGANYKVITGSDFCHDGANSWPEDKLKDLFVLNFIYSHPAAAVHFWDVFPNEYKTVSLRQHFRMNYFFAMQNLKKKPHRIAQPQQRRNGTNPS